MRVPVSITWLFRTGSRLNFFDKSEYQTFFYTFCGDFECGTYPAAAVGFIPDRSSAFT